MKHILRSAICLLLTTLTLPAWSQVKHQSATTPAPVDRHFHLGKLLYADNFQHGLGEWKIEMEKPGAVSAEAGVLDIDVPAGVTVWFRHELKAPVVITFETTMISAGGANDRVSDLNSFWMATDPTAPANLFAHPRSGAFATYNTLQMYYVGLGGNGNTTTRFRRYIGDAVERPLLPENDLFLATHPDKGLIANHTQCVTLVADGNLIQYWRDNEKIFEMIDRDPYLKGWFGIRTTKNHMQVKNLRIMQLLPNH